MKVLIGGSGGPPERGMEGRSADVSPEFFRGLSCAAMPAWERLSAMLLLGAACAPVQRPDQPPAAGCAAAFCDDFEAYPVGGPPGGRWTVSGSPGETAVIDGSKAWSGSRAVLLRHAGTAHDAIYMTLGTPVLPLPSNDLHGRLMLFITKAPPRLHWDNVRATGPLPGGKEAQYNLGGESSSFLSNYEPHDCYRRTQVPYPQ